ncbi:AMP-binding protein [Nonlabens spongiae]|uniref:AMP-binding protein n=1 Tax=Nonlabens spongiae TaxID=331648 RepID=A0A1W6MLC7_9FLAO|nr:AMP-binding protein [Nonlabens spongiae]ARN78377.1 AMP-binding protein [Nonlabens spongiae]
MDLFKSVLKLKGFPIDQATERLQEIQSIPDSAYAEYLENRKNDILKFHFENNAYYKNILGGQLPKIWNDVPILTKKDLQAPLSNRLSKGYEKGVYVNKTSGSSGTPFIFAKDKFSHALTWAYILDRYNNYDIDFGKALQARFYGIPLDFVGYRKERLKDFLSHRYRFPVFDLSDNVLDEYVKTFAKKSFQYVYGYTSSLVLFAKYLKSKNLVLNEVCPSLKSCIVTSEMLFPEDKKLLEESFGVFVINEYGASELDLIAFTNKDDEFELNNQTLFIEIVDDDHQPVPHGTTGNIIVTSLYNKAHSMIRYAIGDLGIIDPASTAKNQILKKLVGRTNDVAVLAKDKKVPGLTFYYVTKSVIDDTANIKEFIVEQLAVDEFKVTYTADQIIGSGKEKAIKEALEKYVGTGLKISIVKVDQLDRGARGKLKQFISHL